MAKEGKERKREKKPLKIKLKINQKRLVTELTSMSREEKDELWRKIRKLESAYGLRKPPSIR
mgnify:CR=1 FL=1